MPSGDTPPSRADSNQPLDDQLKIAWTHARNRLGRLRGERSVIYWLKDVEPELHRTESATYLRLQTKAGARSVNIPAYIRFDLASALAERGIVVDDVVVVANPPKPVQTEAPSGGSQASPELTFANFISDRSNAEAYAAAESIANDNTANLGRQVIIFGSYGVGKTHLLHAIANRSKRGQPYLLHSEAIVRQFVTASQSGRLDRVIGQWRSRELILIDDLHFLAGREATQRELILTLEVLQKRSARIVITMTRPPSRLHDLAPQLLARLKGYAIIGIDSPSRTLQRRYLEEAGKKLGLTVSGSTLNAIVDLSVPSLRELGGIMRRIANYQAVGGGVRLDPVDVQRLFAHHAYHQTEKTLTVPQIQKAVAAYFTISMEELCGSSRKRIHVHARFAAINLIRQLTSLPMTAIGGYFGDRDRSQIFYALKAVNKPRAERLRKDIAMIESNLRRAD